MGQKTRDAGNLIGGMLVALGIYKFLFGEGEGWVVWIILGFLLGGFDYVATLLKRKDPQ